MMTALELDPPIFEAKPLKFDLRAPAYSLVVEINDHRLSIQGGGQRSRVIPNILHILDHLDEHRAEANFYMTSGQLKVFPEVATLVNSRGHEIGLCLETRTVACKPDVENLRYEIEAAIGRKVKGIYIKGRNRGWHRLLARLAETGFQYCLIDFVPAAPFPGHISSCFFEGGLSIAVLPPSQNRFAGIPVIFGGESGIRLYPLWFLRKCLRQAALAGNPAIMYFPLWEFDPHLPRRLIDPIRSIRHYGNLAFAEFKLKRLLAEFDFVTIPELLMRAAVAE